MGVVEGMVGDNLRMVVGNIEHRGMVGDHLRMISRCSILNIILLMVVGLVEQSRILLILLPKVSIGIVEMKVLDLVAYLHFLAHNYRMFPAPNLYLHINLLRHIVLELLPHHQLLPPPPAASPPSAADIAYYHDMLFNGSKGAFPGREIEMENIISFLIRVKNRNLTPDQGKAELNAYLRDNYIDSDVNLAYVQEKIDDLLNPGTQSEHDQIDNFQKLVGSLRAKRTIDDLAQPVVDAPRRADSPQSAASPQPAADANVQWTDKMRATYDEIIAGNQDVMDGFVLKAFVQKMEVLLDKRALNVDYEIAQIMEDETNNLPDNLPDNLRPLVKVFVVVAQTATFAEAFGQNNIANQKTAIANLAKAVTAQMLPRM